MHPFNTITGNVMFPSQGQDCQDLSRHTFYSTFKGREIREKAPRNKPLISITQSLWLLNRTCAPSLYFLLTDEEFRLEADVCNMNNQIRHLSPVFSFFYQLVSYLCKLWPQLLK